MRIKKAFSKASFQVETIVDPERSKLDRVLNDFSDKAEKYDLLRRMQRQPILK